jgi:hypothetical protein
MPFPLLLLLLVGGAAVVAASSSAQLEPEGLRLAPGAFRKPAGPLSYEKFRDPVLVCLEQNGLRFDVGLGYLDVPNTAAARVAAMRSRIGTPTYGATTFGTSSTIGKIAEASYQKSQELAIKLARTYEDASRLPYVAQALRIPIEQAQKQAAEILSLSRGAQDRFLREAAKYPGISNALMAGVSAFAAGKLSPAEAYATGAQLVGEVFASAAASTVPVLGAITQVAAGFVAADIRAREAAAKERCEANRLALAKAQEAILKDLSPLPLHIESEDCDEPYWQAQHLSNLLRGFRSLSIRDKGAIQEWWTLAQAMMSNPEVFAAFNRTGRGGVGWRGDGIPLAINSRTQPQKFNVHLDGRYLGSDEQVMMVAAPFAVANGYDVDRFARALWEKSQGWRGADPLSFVYAKTPDRSFSICDITYTDPGKGAAGVKKESGRSCRPICGGPGVPMNAWHLNFAVLARDAAELARTLPKG